MLGVASVAINSKNMAIISINTHNSFFRLYALEISSPCKSGKGENCIVQYFLSSKLGSGQLLEVKAIAEVIKISGAGVENK